MASPRSGQLTLLGLATHLVAAERWYTAILGSAAAILIAVALAPPLLEASAARAGLRDTMTQSGGVGVQRGTFADGGQFDAFQRQARQTADPLLVGHLLGPVEIAHLGPVAAASVNGEAPQGRAATSKLMVAYASDLARHVDVVQGQLPEVVQDTSAAAASMPEDRADRLGFHLSDRVCLAGPAPAAGDAGLWCARLVGLWRTMDRGDPYWGSTSSPPDIFTSRDGFFALLGQQRSPSASAQRWFWPSRAMVSLADAAAIIDNVGRLRQAMRGSPGLELQTSLDQQLRRYDAARGVATISVELTTAALLVLGLVLMAMLSSRLLRLQARELGLLRVRGWSSTTVQRLLAIELVTVAGTGMVAGVIVAWAAQTILGPSHPLWPLTGLGLTDLEMTSAAMFASLQGAVIVLAFAAARAARQLGPLQAPPDEAVESIEPGWRIAVEGLLALPAAPLLLLPRLLGAQPPTGLQQFADAFGYIIDVGALAILALAATHLVSPASALLAHRYQGVEGTLARWQLRGWWRRHSVLGFMLVFGVATATAAAVEIAHLLLDNGRLPALLGPGDFRHGLLLSLSIAVVAAAAMTVIAFITELAFARRARRSDYGALLADGLPARSIRRSLKIEHNHVLAVALPIGAVLGLALAWGAGPGAGLDGALPVPAPGLSGFAAAIGVLMATAPVLIGGLVAGWLVRGRVGLLGGDRSLESN